MCAGKEFQVEGADTDTEKAREEKLLVIPGGLVRRNQWRNYNFLGPRQTFATG